VTDPRVEAWHGATMTVRLQMANCSASPIPLRVTFDVGHGMGSTHRKVCGEPADECASYYGARGAERRCNAAADSSRRNCCAGILERSAFALVPAIPLSCCGHPRNWGCPRAGLSSARQRLLPDLHVTCSLVP